MWYISFLGEVNDVVKEEIVLKCKEAQSKEQESSKWTQKQWIMCKAQQSIMLAFTGKLRHMSVVDFAMQIS